MGSFLFTARGTTYEISGERFPNLANRLKKDVGAFPTENKETFRKIAEIVDDVLGAKASQNKDAIGALITKGIVTKI